MWQLFLPFQKILFLTVTGYFDYRRFPNLNAYFFATECGLFSASPGNHHFIYTMGTFRIICASEILQILRMLHVVCIWQKCMKMQAHCMYIYLHKIYTLVKTIKGPTRFSAFFFCT